MLEFEKKVRNLFEPVVNGSFDSTDGFSRAWGEAIAESVSSLRFNVPMPGIFPPVAGPGPDPTFSSLDFFRTGNASSAQAAARMSSLAVPNRGASVSWTNNARNQFERTLERAYTDAFRACLSSVSGTYSGSCQFANNATLTLESDLFRRNEDALNALVRSIVLWSKLSTFTPSPLAKGSFVVPSAPFPFAQFLQ